MLKLIVLLCLFFIHLPMNAGKRHNLFVLYQKYYHNLQDVGHFL